MNNYNQYNEEELIKVILMKDEFIKILHNINKELINKNKDLKLIVDALNTKKIITLT